MGRRIKEEPEIHQKRIAAAAKILFQQQGMDLVRMDEIAEQAGYSKATLYVYFNDKQHVVQYITLESMKVLYQYLHTAISSSDLFKEQYMALWFSLYDFHQKEPLYFTLALGHVQFQNLQTAYTIAYELYIEGEKMMGDLSEFINLGISKGLLRENLHVPATVFFFWASISGTIQMAIHKQEYIQAELGLTMNSFITYSADVLYQSIMKG